ncbi:MAG: hypothetical protein Q4D41_00235 [Prevotellaceae bacterium]|nr:hypothetical protein [Prevotellaceae bacterium]
MAINTPPQGDNHLSSPFVRAVFALDLVFWIALVVSFSIDSKLMFIVSTALMMLLGVGATLVYRSKCKRQFVPVQQNVIAVFLSYVIIAVALLVIFLPLVG